MKHLVIGGVRSGKSAYAQKIVTEIAKENVAKNLAENSLISTSREDANVLYIATAQALDSSMQERIEKHQKNRPATWRVIEEPLNIAAVLSDPANQNATILIECMTLWLTNVIFSNDDFSDDDCSNDKCSDDKCSEKQTQPALKQTVPQTVDLQETFLTALKTTQANVVIVTSEVGLGVMPMNALARQFADQAGELNQTLAQLSDHVTLVCAGLPLALK